MKINMEPENQPLENEIAKLETMIFSFHLQLEGCTSATNPICLALKALDLRIDLFTDILSLGDAEEDPMIGLESSDVLHNHRWW